MMFGSQPRFRMLMLGDAHLSAGEDPESSRHKFERTTAGIRGQLLKPGLDLLLLLGDMVHQETPENLECLRRHLATLPMPLAFSVPGNHDKTTVPHNPALEETPPCGLGSADGALPAGVREFRNMVFLLIDNADGDGDPAAGIRERNQAVRRLMVKYRAWPKLVLCHVPLVPMRAPDVLRRSFNYPTWMNQDGELLEIIENEAETVIAVLSGHVHLTGHVVRRGISHITTSGLLSWPHDVAVLDCHTDRIDVRMHGLLNDRLPGGFTGLPLGNGIHDAHGAECRFTDEMHPTFGEYVAGTPAERAFTIRLCGHKRIKG